MRVLLLLALAACDRWADCEDLADWNLTLSRPGTDEGADATVTRGSDGAIYVVMSDPFSDIDFDGRRLSGPHLATVSPAGAILALEPVPAVERGTYAGAARPDGAGGVVVYWSGEEGTLRGYGPDLQERWSHPVGRSNFELPYDVGPSGAVAYVSADLAPPQPRSELGYLEPTGAVRWRILLPTDLHVGHIEVDASGDVFVFVDGSDGPRRVRRAAADGALLAELELPKGLPTLTQPDGSFYYAHYAPDGSAAAVFARHDAAGTELWAQRRPLLGMTGVVVTPDGGLLAQTVDEEAAGLSYGVLVLDGANGVVRAEDRACSHVIAFGADENSYFALGLIGSSSVGLARFAQP